MIWRSPSWPFYWTKEISHLPRSQRAKLIGEARRACYEIRAPYRWRWTIGSLFFPVIAGAFVAVAISRQMEWIFELVIVICAPFMCLWFVWIEPVLNRTALMGALREVLLQRGMRPAYCFQCGYDLQGSVSSACPECGDLIAPVKSMERSDRGDRS